MAGDSDLENKESFYNHRLADYKCKTSRSNQEFRRHYLLEEQKRRREDSFNAFRDFSDVFSSDHLNAEEADESYEIYSEDLINYRSENDKFPKLKHLFMFSEWMLELPMDFEDDWVFMPCPAGKRCLVKSTKGSTVAFGKTGYQRAWFKSALPSGGCNHPPESKFSNSDVTVLDCIWNPGVKKYFVMDVLYWKSQSYLDTDIGFRNFWLKSKLDELPGIGEISKENPFPFVPLDCYSCDPINMSSVMSKYPYFQSNKPQLDGILFFHKEGFYTPGTTPLVLWLKPFMLSEVFGQDLCLAEEYSNIRPMNYTTMHDFIYKYEELRKRKKKRWNSNKVKLGKGLLDMEVCSSEPTDIEHLEK